MFYYSLELIFLYVELKKKKKKELGTFLSLGKEKIISCDEITEHDKTVVIEILCKVCAKCKGQLLDDPDIEGAV